jgi:hypothetical protein
MAKRQQVCVHLPRELYLRALEDSKRFQFSFSDFIGRILDDFYHRNDKNFIGASPVATNDELDAEAIEAHSPNNPFKFSSLGEALEFLHGNFSPRI